MLVNHPGDLLKHNTEESSTVRLLLYMRSYSDRYCLVIRTPNPTSPLLREIIRRQQAHRVRVLAIEYVVPCLTPSPSHHTRLVQAQLRRLGSPCAKYNPQAFVRCLANPSVYFGRDLLPGCQSAAGSRCSDLSTTQTGMVRQTVCSEYTVQRQGEAWSLPEGHM